MHKHNCNSADLHTLVTDPENYIISVYSHGDKTTIYDQFGEAIIDVDNAPDYKNTIFYSTACMTAKELGEAMRSSNCLFYYGFDYYVYYMSGNDSELEEYFIKTHNYALKLLLAGENDPYIIIEKTTSFYLEIIDEVRNSYPAFAGHFRENLENIAIYTEETTIRRI